MHLTERGYELLAENIVKEAKVLIERQSSRGKKPELHNTSVGQEIRSWGGFFCTVGFGKTTVATHKMLRGGGAQRHHPLLSQLRGVGRTSHQPLYTHLLPPLASEANRFLLPPPAPSDPLHSGTNQRLLLHSDIKIMFTYIHINLIFFFVLK